MTTTNSNTGVLSFILLSYHSGNRLRIAYEKIRTLFEKENIDFEIVIIDDGSKDHSFRQAAQLEQEDNRVKAFQLSRNYTSHYAIFAGLSVCTGSCVVMIPDDEQLPYLDIVSMYRIWEQGEKVIIPHRKIRDEKWLTRQAANLFYRIMNSFSDIQFPPGGADSFLIDREVIDILNAKVHPIRTTSMSEILRLGFDPVFYPYTRPQGINQKSRWTFSKKYQLAKDFFFSSSTFPIRFITYIGVGFSALSFLLILFYLYVKLFGSDDYWRLDQVPGWVSTITFIAFFSGLILLSLGVIAEYIWRIYEEVKARPGFLIRGKKIKNHDKE